MSCNPAKKTEFKTTLKNGQELLVRSPLPEEAVAMVAYLNQVGGESDNLLFGKNEFRLSVEQEAEYLRNMAADASSCMLAGFVDGQIISVAQISSLKRPRIAHNAEIAISVQKAWWGCGVGTVMMERLIAFARATGTIRNITLGVRFGNDGAIALYEKMGFRLVGTHRDYFLINGCYHDEHLMDLQLSESNAEVR